MDTTTLDGLARELGSVSTRRGFVRLLSGAVAMGAGLTLVTPGESFGRGRGNTSRGAVGAEGRGRKKKVTICYQGKTRLVKKSKLDKYPGYTKGACPGGGNGGGGGQTCTTWIISGGPSPTDPIRADDDFYIFRGNGASILADSDHRASSLNPVPFNASVGEVLHIVAYDAGGCRSLSPLWLHCAATGQKREVFSGLASPHCSFGAGTFIDQNITVSL